MSACLVRIKHTNLCSRLCVGLVHAGGLFYIQNAKPDGVAAWLVAEVTDRVLRWADDKKALVKAKGLAENADAMDQVCVCARARVCVCVCLSTSYQHHPPW